MELMICEKEDLNVPALSDDEIRILRVFVGLESGKCFNDHEKGDGTNGVRERICKCVNRANPYVISCVHAELEYLGDEGAINVLKKTKSIFAKANKNMNDLCYLYHDILLLFDFIRQALEGSRENLIKKIGAFELWKNLFSKDDFINAVYKLADEVADYNGSIIGNNYVRFLVRFLSLKINFSSIWEPRALNTLQSYAQMLINNQPDLISSSSYLSSAE